MSFTDTPYLLLAFGIIIIVFMAMNSIVNPILDGLEGHIPTTMNESLHRGWDANISFYDTHFAALFIILLILSAFLTVALPVPPIVLAVWLLVNILSLILWDYFSAILIVVEASALNTGGMNTAFSFFTSEIGKIIPVTNMILALIMLGKHWRD